jgi:hypothetical protein
MVSAELVVAQRPRELHDLRKRILHVANTVSPPVNDEVVTPAIVSASTLRTSPTWCRVP